MPHAVATVRSLFDDPRLVFHTSRWCWGSMLRSEGGDDVATFFEGEFVVASERTPPRSVWVRLAKRPPGSPQRKVMRINTGDPAPVNVDFASGEVEIGEGHRFKAEWGGEAGWENCLRWLILAQYERFPVWRAAVSGMRTILEIDHAQRHGEGRKVSVPASPDDPESSPLGLDWRRLRPDHRDFLFVNLNGWLLDTNRFNDLRVNLVCQKLGVGRPEGISNERSLSLRELIVRVMSLAGVEDRWTELSLLEREVYGELLKVTRDPARAADVTVRGAKEFLQAVSTGGRLPKSLAPVDGLGIIVVSNSTKGHVASFLHGSGLARYVFAATNREHFRGRAAPLKKDLAASLGIPMDRLAVLHDKTHHFLDGAIRIVGKRNDMQQNLALCREMGILGAGTAVPSSDLDSADGGR